MDIALAHLLCASGSAPPAVLCLREATRSVPDGEQPHLTCVVRQWDGRLSPPLSVAAHAPAAELKRMACRHFALDEGACALALEEAGELLVDALGLGEQGVQKASSLLLVPNLLDDEAYSRFVAPSPSLIGEYVDAVAKRARQMSRQTHAGSRCEGARSKARIIRLTSTASSSGRWSAKLR